MKPTLQYTTNYKLFHSHKLQRDIDHPHLRKIVASMREHGFWPSQPITVKRTGKTFRIVDGHHRWLAAKEAKVELAYVVATTEGEDMAAINSLQKSWSLKDWLKHYVRDGRPSYIRLHQLIERDHLGITTAIALLSKAAATGGTDTKRFKAGVFEIVSESLYNTVVDFCEWLKPYNTSAKSSRCINAFALVLQTPEFDLERLKHGIEEMPHVVKDARDKESFLDAFQRAYNYKKRIHTVPLRFLAEEAAQGRVVEAFKRNQG